MVKVFVEMGANPADRFDNPPLVSACKVSIFFLVLIWLYSYLTLNL